MFCMGSEINGHPGRGLRRLDNEFRWPYSRSYTRRHAGRKEGAPDEHERLYQPRHPFIRQGYFFPLCFNGWDKHEIKNIFSSSSFPPPPPTTQLSCCNLRFGMMMMMLAFYSKGRSHRLSNSIGRKNRLQFISRRAFPDDFCRCVCMYVFRPRRRRKRLM